MLSSRIFIYVVNGVLLKTHIATGSIAASLLLAVCAFFVGWLASTAVQQANEEAAERASNSGKTAASWYISREDLQEFQRRLEEEKPAPGTTAWHPMLEKDITGRVQYKAKRRNVPGKMTEYMSTTVVPGATAEEMCDFSLDDPYRAQWEGFMKLVQLLEQGRPPAGVTERQQVVRYVRQFPFNFISKREYIIARSVFRDGDALYAICKGIDHPGAKAAAAASGTSGIVRVGHYSSCWRFRTVPDPWGAAAPACEMVLLHCEDMRIPDNLARVAIRVGMLGYVKEMTAAVPKFLKARRARVGPTEVDPQTYSLCAPPTGEALQRESDVASAVHSFNSLGNGGSSSHGGVCNGRRWRDRRKRGLELAGHKVLLRPKGGAIGRLRLRHAMSKTSSCDSWIIGEGSQSSGAGGSNAGDRSLNRDVEAAAAVPPPPSPFASSAGVSFAHDGGTDVATGGSKDAAGNSPTGPNGAMRLGDADAAVRVRVVAPPGVGAAAAAPGAVAPAAAEPLDGMSLLPSCLPSIGEADSVDEPAKPTHVFERLGLAAGVLLVAVLAGQVLHARRRRQTEQTAS